MLTLLALLTTAHAFETTKVQLSLTRQSIREENPSIIGISNSISIRYDEEGTCFVIGRTTEYRCGLNYNARESAIRFYMNGREMAQLLLNELVWLKPECQPEFAKLFGANNDVEFIPADPNDYVPANVYVIPVSAKTADEKVSYTLQ